MKALKNGDVVTVVKLDRLARSSRDLQNILHELQEMGCGFVSLGESWCDTTTDVGRLVMTIMGGIAEFERNLIRKRCEDGIQRAKRKGTKFGRPTVLDHSQRSAASGNTAAVEPTSVINSRRRICLPKWALRARKIARSTETANADASASALVRLEKSNLTVHRWKISGPF